MNPLAILVGFVDELVTTEDERLTAQTAQANAATAQAQVAAQVAAARAQSETTVRIAMIAGGVIALGIVAFAVTKAA
jgi:hypothetical protein